MAPPFSVFSLDRPLGRNRPPPPPGVATVISTIIGLFGQFFGRGNDFVFGIRRKLNLPPLTKGHR